MLVDQQYYYSLKKYTKNNNTKKYTYQYSFQQNSSFPKSQDKLVTKQGVQHKMVAGSKAGILITLMFCYEQILTVTKRTSEPKAKCISCDSPTVQYNTIQ